MRISQYYNSFKAIYVGLIVIAGMINTTRSGRFARSESRIVGGVNVTPRNKYPMIVALEDPDGNVDCAGTILDKYHVLTAGYCPSRNKVKYALAGVYHVKDPDPRYLQKVAIKTDNTKGTIANNDIAVIKLRTPLVWNDYVAPTNLAVPGWAVLPGTQMKVMIVGWGKGSDQTYPYPATRPLQEVELPLLTTEDCQREWYTFSITGDHVCVKNVAGAGACIGDYGSPYLIYNEADDKYMQIGLHSWTNIECGKEASEIPSVATKVSNFVSWIQEAMRECNPQRPI